MPENFDELLAELYRDFDRTKFKRERDEAKLMIIKNIRKDDIEEFDRVKNSITNQIKKLDEKVSELRISVERLRNSNDNP